MNQPGVTLEALKRSEDGNDLIMRWVEAGGRRTRVAVDADLSGFDFEECDLLERPLTDGSKPGALEMRPFDIRTFRGTRAGPA